MLVMAELRKDVANELKDELMVQEAKIATMKNKLASDEESSESKKPRKPLEFKSIPYNQNDVQDPPASRKKKKTEN